MIMQQYIWFFYFSRFTYWEFDFESYNWKFYQDKTTQNNILNYFESIP